MKNLIRFDWAIKRLLRNKSNFVILEGLLSELLYEDIKIESILESEGNQDTSDSKYNRVDLLVQNSKKELIIIEIQNEREIDYVFRMMFGVSKLLVDNMKAGMAYSSLKKIISVNIVYFDLGQGDDYIYHGFTNFVGIHKNDTLRLNRNQQKIYNTDKIADLYPEYYILKVNQFDEVALNTLDEWIYFLKTEEIKDSFKAKGLKEAKEELDVMKLTQAERKEYDRYIENWRYETSLFVSNYRDGELDGIAKMEVKMKELEEKNKAERWQEKIKVVKRCIDVGMTIADAAEIAGLTDEEVKNII